MSLRFFCFIRPDKWRQIIANLTPVKWWRSTLRAGKSGIAKIAGRALLDLHGQSVLVPAAGVHALNVRTPASEFRDLDSVQSGALRLKQLAQRIQERRNEPVPGTLEGSFA